MDFINQARNLADTLKDKAQEAATNTAKGIEEVVDVIKNTADACRNALGGSTPA